MSSHFLSLLCIFWKASQFYQDNGDDPSHKAPPDEEQELPSEGNEPEEGDEPELWLEEEEGDELELWQEEEEGDEPEL